MYNSKIIKKEDTNNYSESVPPEESNNCFYLNIGDCDDFNDCIAPDTIIKENKNENLTQNFLYTYNSLELENLYKSYGKSFNNKKECIEHIIDTKNSLLKLFSFDILLKDNIKNNPKNYIAKTYQEIYKLIEYQPLKNLYENFEREQQIKLFLDIDYKIINSNQKIINNYINDIITSILPVLNNELSGYNFDNPQIIILNASTMEKISLHIIYNNIVFEDIRYMNKFMNNFKDKYQESKFINLIDLSVYKVGSLRIYKTSKINKKNVLLFYDSFNYTVKDDYSLFLDTLLCNTEDKKVIDFRPSLDEDKIKRKNQIKIKDNKGNIELINFNLDDMDLDLVQKYLDLININRAKKYESWLQIGMTLFNTNINSIRLWINWSRSIDEYKNESEYIYLYNWNKFSKFKNGINFLKYYAKIDNPSGYNKLRQELDKLEEEKTIQNIINDKQLNLNEESVYFEFNKEYLLMENDKDDDIVKTNLDIFVNTDNYKILCIHSPYNTGKTTLVKKILNNFNKVLFISYRKTLTYNIQGSFYEFKFHSYLDNEYHHEKFICQIDSLEKLCNHYFVNYGKYPKYDLVIIDESESVLNHFHATTLKNKALIYKYMKNIINNSKKAIFLDGDICNRTVDYMLNFGNAIILKNIIKKDKKHFIFRNNKIKYDETIDKNLKEGKNICIVSMSSKLAESYYELYKDKYKCCIHTSMQDDAIMENIKDVNNYWSKFQLIIYSPTIEAGVDLNIQHVDKIFGILAPMSTSQRGFLQMLGRIRIVNDNNVHIYLNGLKYSTKLIYYTFEEAKEYVFYFHDRYLTKIDNVNLKSNNMNYIKNMVYNLENFINNNNQVEIFDTINLLKNELTFNHDNDNDDMSIYYEYDDYVNNMVYNVQEELNKNQKFFVPYLIKLLENKGHTYEFLDEINLENNENTIINYNPKNYKKEIILNEIYTVDEVDDDEIELFFSAKKNGTATRHDKMIIEKYFFKKLWNIDEFKIADNYLISKMTLDNFDKNLLINSKNFAKKYKYLPDNLTLDNFNLNNFKPSNYNLNKMNLNNYNENILRETKNFVDKYNNYPENNTLETFNFEDFKYNKDKLKIIDINFFNHYFRKSYVLRNLRNIMDKNKVTDIFDTSTDDLVIDFKSVVYDTKINLIKLIIYKLGFNLNNMDIKIKRDDLIENLDKLVDDVEIFGNPQNRIMFGFDDKITNSVKKYLGFLNGILHNWGLCIKQIKKSKRLPNNKIDKNYSYFLSFYDIFYLYF